jgi:hypothetical protein
MKGARSGQPEGRKETDERAVGTAFRQLDGSEAVGRTEHVDNEVPRLLGETGAEPIAQVDSEEDEV